jgi:hypothetical protein
MAEKKHVLYVKTGKVVAREEILAAVDEQLKAAPEEVALEFTIRPIAAEEEFSRVVDRMAVAADTNCCDGCD